MAEWVGNQIWKFVDGDGQYGINQDTGRSKYSPQLAIFNSKLYAIWHEFNGSKNQIRIAEWDGDQTWRFVDGNSTTGINKRTDLDATEAQLIAFNHKLFATWYESDGSFTQIRVAEWDGDQTWNFVDGGATTGINKVATLNAQWPTFAVFNTGLFVIWKETNGSNFQFRVAKAETE